MYMGSVFPTVDDLTSQLVKIGRGAHIYNIDISRAFCHLAIDPIDYDLLGLQWNNAYIDTQLPFGARHGSQFFQRASDTIRYIIHQRQFPIINYIDDFLGFGTPVSVQRSYDALYDIMHQLGLTISKSKLITPCTRAVCLGIVVDTVDATLSIPEEKLHQVKNAVHLMVTQGILYWQLHSLFGLLLYIHKCVKLARCFLNRMLEVLRQATTPTKI